MSDETWFTLTIPSNVLSSLSTLQDIKQGLPLSVAAGECTAKEAVFCREDAEVIEIYFTPGAHVLALRFGAIRCPAPMPDERPMQPLAQFGLDALLVHLPDHHRK